MEKPELYSTVNYPQRYAVSDFSDEFVDEIGKMSGHCLDVGSGSGDTVVDFILPKLDINASLVCSDISENMVNFAKEKYKDNERLSFMKLNIEAPGLSEDLIGHFHHVLSSYCLHWCQDMRQAFENIFALLQPGGTAFVTFLANFPGMEAYNEMAAMPRYQPYMKDVDSFIPVFQYSEHPQENLKALMKDVGFEVHHCSVRERTYTFENPDIFLKFMLATNPFIERIPANLRKEYELDLFEAAAKQSIVFKKDNNNGHDHSILIKYYSFLVYLKKPLTK